MENKQKYEVRKVADLHVWEDNPSFATDDDLDRLEKQMDKLGMYKPLIVNQNGIVLGGNKRLVILKRKGIEEAMCSIVYTDNRVQMLEYALSDNDNVGVADEAKLRELIAAEPQLETHLFAVHSRPGKIVTKLKRMPTSKPKEQPCRHCPKHCGSETVE
jgi:hypothetical protein